MQELNISTVSVSRIIIIDDAVEFHRRAFYNNSFDHIADQASKYARSVCNLN